ncbi:MAG TPA: serine/threonine-protein kinase [Solirubrobacterales bacterium]
MAVTTARVSRAPLPLNSLTKFFTAHPSPGKRYRSAMTVPSYGRTNILWSMLTAGTMVEGHRIEGLLGEGGMATVYEAHQASLNRLVALKIVTRRVGGEPAFEDRFLRECEAQARLDHPNIVPIYTSGRSKYGLWLTMRLVKGPTLCELLREGPLAPDRALEILVPIAEALDVAHEHGLIHRDITPQNILIDERSRRPYLADFGIAKGIGDRSLTRPGQFMGTLDYVAPEQIQDGPTGVATDVYSLAVILFECLAGRIPFDKDHEGAVMFAHVEEDPPQASEIEPALPKAIDAVLEKGLAKQPSRRYGKASDLFKAADEALHPKPSVLPQSSPPPPHSASSKGKARRSGRRHFFLGLAVFLPAAMALSLGVLASGSSSGEPTHVSAGDLEIDLPSNWTGTESSRSGVPGLPLENSLILKPKDRWRGETVVVGISPATGKTLLPPALRAAQGRSVRGTPVSLGGLEALRYRGLRAPGQSVPLDVFASPISSGVATVACRPGGRGTEFFELCQRLASTLKLHRGDAFPLGPSPVLARVLRRQIATLRERRAALRRRLGAVTAADRQAAIASALAAAFRRTARALSARSVSPQSAAGLDSLVDALRTTRDGYKRLATAARHEDSAAYRSAVAEVTESEAAVDRRLLALRELGYRIDTSG